MKWFSLLYSGDLHPSSDEKIIKAEDYTTLLSSVDVLSKAESDAEEKLQKTQEKCKKLEQKAKEKGFSEGLEQFNEQILYLNDQLQSLRHQVQQLVLPIALKAAKRIVGKELETHPETIVDIVLQAISPIAESQQVTIFVSKEDKEHLDAEKGKIKEILSQVQNLTIQERADVEPGGCIIKTESGMINATIENQWKALERAFEKYKPKP